MTQPARSDDRRPPLPRVLGVALGLGLLATGRQVPAQAASDTVYMVSGSVVNGLTGAPLGRALVTSGDRRLATMTDGDGKFSLRVSVPARDSKAPAIQFGRAMDSGMVLLVAQKPHFLSDSPQRLVLDDPQKVAEVHLTLMPLAALSGHVTAAGGAAAGVRVQLLHHQPMEGRLVWQIQGSEPVEGDGQFHFSNLRPGEYTVVTAVWRGDPPAPESDDTAVSEQYPPVFAGNVAELSGATRQNLHWGDTADLDLQVRPAKFFRVRVPLADSGSRQGLQARFAGVGNFDGVFLRYNDRDHAFEGMLPDGSYEVALSRVGEIMRRAASSPLQPSSPAMDGSALVTIHVAGAPVTTAPVVLAPATTATVRIDDQSTHEQDNDPNHRQLATPPRIELLLQPAEGSPAQFAQAHSNGEAQFTVEHLLAGTYRVTARTSQGYIATLRCGGVDLLRQPLTVGANGLRDPIEVAVRDDTGQLSGKITGGEDADQRFAVLVPVEGAGSLAVIPVSQDGTFESQPLPPGNYRLMAGAGQPWQMPYREEAMQHALEGKALSITIRAGEKRSADPPWIGAFDALMP